MGETAFTVSRATTTDQKEAALYEEMRRQFEAVDDTHQSPVVKRFLLFLDESGLRLDKTGLETYRDELDRLAVDGVYKATTAHNYMSMVRSRMRKVVDVLEEHGQITDAQVGKFENAIRKLKPKVQLAKDVKQIDREEDTITEEDERRLMEESTDKHVPVWIKFLLATGCRVSEMLQIEPKKHIEYQKDKVAITVIGKGMKPRVVYISREHLREIQDHFGGKTYLFSHHGKKFNRNSVTMRIRAEGRYILQRDIHAHTMRHTFVTRKIDKGCDLSAVSKYVGHSSTAITSDIYTHITLKWDDLK